MNTPQDREAGGRAGASASPPETLEKPQNPARGPEKTHAEAGRTGYVEYVRPAYLPPL